MEVAPTEIPDIPPLPSPAKRKKKKVPSYMKSAPIKLLTHPVDKNIAWSFLISVIFVAIAIVTGFPIVAVLTMILPMVLLARKACASCCRCGGKGCCEMKTNMMSSVDAYWLHDSKFNLYIAHCLFFLDYGLSASKLSDLVRARVLNKIDEEGFKAFDRFTQKVVPVTSGYCWVEDNSFNIDNHIFHEVKRIKNEKQLEDHVNALMSQPLTLKRPLWEIRLISNFGKSGDTVLIVRIHHAVSDGISLVKILCNHLCDNNQIIRLKPRYGGTTFPLNVFRALVVGPMTFLTWLVFSRRDYNYLRRGRKGSGERTIAWSRDIRFNKVNRIKQVMRCTMNDVLMTAICGAVRSYFRRNGIQNPPNVTTSVPVDLRYEPSSLDSVPEMGTRYALVNVRLPTNTEGTIPRLWEVRHRMEELKTSADPVVMYGAVHFLLHLLPEFLAQWLMGTLNRRASVFFANVPGPDDVLVLGSRRVKKLLCWVACRPEIPLSFSIISYAGSLQLTVSADKAVVPMPNVLIREFLIEIDRLSNLLARRRIPGEQRRRSSYTAERRQEEIIKPPVQELQHKLYAVQEEIHEISQKMDAMSIHDPSFEQPDNQRTHAVLSRRLSELKEEFSELMSELRRRKSLADGIVITVEDEDLDGGLRRPRKRALSSSGRRSSLTSVVSSVSTARPLTTPTTPHHAPFVMSTPNLDSAVSPVLNQQRMTFLDSGQIQYLRRKSDFN